MIRSFGYFVGDLVRNRRLVLQLTQREFKIRYLGSHLGFLWAFVQPLITIGVFWFVFEVGFKSVPVAGFPFVLWLVTGLIPWFFLSESLTLASTSVSENGYLVKKVAFRVSTLPLIKILSAVAVHVVFVGVLFVLFLFSRQIPGLPAIQVLYYLVAAMVLLVGLAWLTSALTVFLKDLGQVVAILIQFGFWFTPIFWSIDILPERYHLLVQLNPIFYITEGYRDALIHQVWFWERGWQTVYFWGVAGFVFVLGAYVFTRLRPFFADAL